MANSNIRITITIMTLGLLVACQPGISANSRMMFSTWISNSLIVTSDDDGCPNDVYSLIPTCVDNTPDPVNQSCQAANAVVRWYPLGKPIKIIWENNKNPTKVCLWKDNKQYYQCTLANVSTGEEYYYTVAVLDADKYCEIDPKIIIK